LEEENKRHNENIKGIEAEKDLFKRIVAEAEKNAERNAEKNAKKDVEKHPEKNTEKKVPFNFIQDVDHKQYTFLVAKIIAAPTNTEYVELKIYYHNVSKEICAVIFVHSAGLPMCVVVDGDKLIGAGKVGSEKELQKYSDVKSWYLKGDTVYFKE